MGKNLIAKNYLMQLEVSKSSKPLIHSGLLDFFLKF